jgi:dehydrogenase/reductase SDR family protein 12
MPAFSQFMAFSQFYLYGRRHFNQNGWLKHMRTYEKPDLLEQKLDLSGHVYMITGANAGIGKEITQFLASNRATVYMVCRNRERAESARAEIVSATGCDTIHVLLGDVSLEADVRRCWQEFVDHAGSSTPRLDALVCNAGAGTMPEKELTAEGHEIIFASHLLFGTYLLGSLAMPSLENTAGSRLVVVSSGGMLNTAFPRWDVATSTEEPAPKKFDGVIVYAYQKRGQVLLCERWAAQHPKVKVVSCHPGWAGTSIVETLGDSAKYLEPMRTPWQGAEGIAWLCVAPAEKVQTGEFYLDRAVQPKHMAGPFFTEGSFTKNSPESIDEMMKHLDDLANANKERSRGA